ncbi:alpha/beta fold hydrolase [Pedobacter nutrimenti]|jgi:type IV secretory pathway VirJ component|uniref:Virulence protein VirJ n=1 Tax=Pedobacter nutrimenti TaxID=1241337 RepID=A0A318UAR2_9SPHI|nr:alpha/beta fold hydrolase [Pedobacter nutrimenti]PYF68867.1 virulence protein VirJ [Pedobacter nutrimenti]
MNFKLSLSLLLLSFSIMVKAQKKAPLSALPLHTIQRNENKPLVFYLSGDGGWNKFSQNLSQELADNGYALVALDTRKYFWEQKTPAQFALDAESIIEHYLKAWNKSSFVILGYSFGADVGAFLPTHLAAEESQKLKSLVLLSPGFSTDFVTKISNMLGFGGTNKGKFKTYPELLKSPVPVHCIFGKDEESDFYQAIKTSDKIHKIIIPGSHRYDDNIKQVARAIIQGF